jgi:hypothetical protein
MKRLSKTPELTTPTNAASITPYTTSRETICRLKNLFINKLFLWSSVCAYIMPPDCPLQLSQGILIIGVTYEED